MKPLGIIFEVATAAQIIASGAVFISRVLDVVFAAVCAIAMASVLRSLSRHSRTGIGSWALG
jgi:hypothetical protein